jgi:hypothetical protein
MYVSQTAVALQSRTERCGEAGRGQGQHVYERIKRVRVSVVAVVYVYNAHKRHHRHSTKLYINVFILCYYILYYIVYIQVRVCERHGSRDRVQAEIMRRPLKNADENSHKRGAHVHQQEHQRQ